MKQRETPNFVCKELVELAELKRHSTLLEPSIGEGKIIDWLIENQGKLQSLDIQVTGVETNEERCNIARSKGYNVIHGDFLNEKHVPDFDRVIAAPPFKGNIDILHIRAMYDCLVLNGILVSLTSPYWLTNNESHQVEFRKWLENKTYQIFMLPDNTFMEKGKTVPTAIIKIRK